jgi:hypothetical protein
MPGLKGGRRRSFGPLAAPSLHLSLITKNARLKNSVTVENRHGHKRGEKNQDGPLLISGQKLEPPIKTQTKTWPSLEKQQNT